MLRRVLTTLAVAAIFPVAANCGGSQEAVSETSAASSVATCPDGLIALIQRDENSGWLAPNVAQSCLNSMQGSLVDAEALERYLAKHPFTNLDRAPSQVSVCVTKYELRRSIELGQPQRRAAAASFYYLMNSLKQAALSNLEAIAGLDVMLAPDEEPLPPRAGVVYSHPLLHESGDWEKRLRRNCRGDGASFDALVETTNEVLWQVRKLDAALAEVDAEIFTRVASELPVPQELRDTSTRLKATKQAVVMTSAPWLEGRYMNSLQTRTMDLKAMIATENAWELVDAEGNFRPKEKRVRGFHVDNPMNVQEREIRAAFPVQLRATREQLVKRQAKLARAAEFLHTNDRVGRSEFLETMADVEAFDLRVFGQYYQSAPVVSMTSEATFLALAERVETIAKAHPEAGIGPRPSLEGATFDVKIGALEKRVFALAAAKVDVGTLTDEVVVLRDNYLDHVRSLSAEAALSAAECRSQVRQHSQVVEDSKKDFVIGAAVTVATAGAASWLAAARAAAQAGEVANAGMAWARAAHVSTLAGRGVQLVKPIASYQAQARILWATLLAGDAYWLGEGVVSTILGCNEAIAERNLEVLDQPLDVTKVGCLDADQSMSRQAVADYKSCALQAALGIGLNLIATLPAARELRHGPLGRPPKR